MSILPSECEQLLISGYVLGNLSPAEALLFEEMLADNADLVEQVTLMQETLDSLYNPPEAIPSSDLRDRIIAAANAQPPVLETAASSIDLSEVATAPKSSLLSRILGAIALIVITALGIANYQLWRTIKTTESVIPSSNKTYLLQSPDLPQAAQAKLIVNSNQLDATLSVTNLPPLPPEKVYALWTVVGKNVPYTTDEKGAILTAVFQVDRSGNFTQQIAVPQPHLEPRIINKIAITIEDRSAPQAHNGSIVLDTPDRLELSVW